MKQICFFGEMVMIMVCLVMPSYGQTVNEGKEKQSEYTRTKELNDVVRQWTKEGWKVHGKHTVISPSGKKTTSNY